MKKPHYIKCIYDCLKTLFILAPATLISFIFVKITNNNINVAIIYILAVILISRITDGYFWGIISSLAGVISMNYYFIYPFFSFDFTRNGYPITSIGMFSISLITSTTTIHLKELVKQANERNEKNSKLNEINNKLLTMNGLKNIIELALEYVWELTGSTVVFYEKSPQTGNTGIIKSCNPIHDRLINSHHEQFMAHWVFENKKPAGIDMGFPGYSSCIYLPLLSHDNIWGVIGIYRTAQIQPDKNTISSLNLIISQVAMAIEGQHLSDNQQLIIIETEKEKMRANLLRAVSHDLRTPLTGMIGASETLLKNKKYLSEEAQNKLIEDIYEDSDWLLHMVENLLSVTRIREGNSSVNKTPEPLEEVVTEAITRIRKRYPHADIQAKIPEDFIMVPMDATLIEQVIINLMENAIKYSGNNSPVTLLITKGEEYITFHVMDEGKGIQMSRIESIFDGCSQTENHSSDSSKGLGIGLSICKTIINSHGGNISARNQNNGGAVFTFTLPLEGSLTNEYKSLHPDC